MTSVLNIPLDLIDTAPQVRTRFKDETIAELAADIRAHGVLQPLVVQQHGTRFMLLIGERRLRAIRFLGDSTAPAILATVSKDMAEEVQLMENIQREDLNTADLAAAIHHLWKKHGTVAEVAKRVHKSSSWVSKRLALALNVGPATTALLDANVKDVELIYNFKKLEKINPAKALQLVPAIIDGTIGRDEVNDWLLDTDDATKETKGEQNGDQPGQQEDMLNQDNAEQGKALEELNGRHDAMKKALLSIATMKDLKALYKTRDEMRRIATDCLAEIFP